MQKPSSAAAWQDFSDGLWDLYEEYRTAILLGSFAVSVAFAYGVWVYLQLCTVRPLLVYVLVAGEMPPICGLCILFGTSGL